MSESARAATVVFSVLRTYISSCLNEDKSLLLILDQLVFGRFASRRGQ